MRKTADLASQLTNAEWLASMPGTDAQKGQLLNCVGCHTLERPLRSKYSADDFMTTILPRMQGYVNQSIPAHPQLRRAERLMEERGDQRVQVYRAAAEFLASINLSSRPQWNFELKTLPRPTGAATRVIYTEYDLPRETISPHDVIVDGSGMVWYSSFGEQNLGRLDPRTGKVTEFPIPEHKPGFPTGLLGLRSDRDGNLWLGNMYQATIAKFDRKTETFKFWPLQGDENIDAAQINMVSPQGSSVDGKVWTQNNGFAGVHRLDIATGKIETWEPFKGVPGPHNIYDVIPDSSNNVYLHRLPPAPYRADRRQERRDQAVRDPDAGFGAAPRHHGCAGPAVVRRISRRPHRHARHQDRAVQGVAGRAAMVVALRRHDRQERGSLDRLDAERSGHAA